MPYNFERSKFEICFRLSNLKGDLIIIISYLFHENHHEAVNFDGHDGGHGGQGGVGGDADQREISDGGEETEARSERAARGCGNLPVYQLFRGLLQNRLK